MTTEQNIKAILECFFSGYKDEIIDAATKRILDIIEAEPELDEWCTDCKEYDQKRHCCPRFRRVIREVAEEVRQNARPTIDADPERHGRWIQKNGMETGMERPFKYYVCSCCDRANYIKENYCPNCRAKMDGGDEHE